MGMIIWEKTAIAIIEDFSTISNVRSNKTEYFSEEPDKTNKLLKTFYEARLLLV
ncbi:MAG: hypothetical protein ABTA16_13410 [Niallia sp.]|uniref:Uncharacterized protein n=1 Tax=Niallia hominis TaxID=3133173 RepID=A0ABV1F808_9BACI